MPRGCARKLDRFFALVEGRSPFEIEFYRQRGESMARQGLVPATAFSAIEQAMWDLAGKALDVPTYVLLGGTVEQRSLSTPTSTGPQARARPMGLPPPRSARRRRRIQGSRALRWVPACGVRQPEIARAIDAGIDAVRAQCSAAVGPSVGIMIDCHSFRCRAIGRRRRSPSPATT